MKTTFWNYYFYQNEFNGFFVKKKNENYERRLWAY